MKTTVTRLFDRYETAARAVEDLERAGIPDDRISLVARRDEHGEHRSFADRDRDHDGKSDVAEDAGKGAATGGVLGGGAGLLAGLGMLAIPGIGPVAAAGWLAATAAGAAAGALAGGATGGIIGALRDAGVSDEDANVYAEGVRRGGALVSVRVDDNYRGEVERILDQHRGADATTRGRLYRDAGWSRFDERGVEFSREDIERERSTWR